MSHLTLLRPERTRQVIALARWKGEKRQSMVLCGWCQKVLGTIEGDRNSHGICPDCAEREFPDPAA